MAGLELFASILIDESVKSALPDSYILRPLSRDDYAKGFFENLQALTSTGEVNGETFMARFDYMKAKEDVFYNIVVESKENKIVANGMSIVESKFIWNLGKVGHIEDVCVSESHQKKGLGRCVMRALNSVAFNVGCLKTILDCDEDCERFYSECGYQRGGISMDYKFEATKEWKSDSSDSKGSNSHE